MSADNYILIEEKKDKFFVWDRFIEAQVGGHFVGEAKTLREAIKLAQKYQKEEIVEYGIGFKLKSKNF